MTPYKHKQVGHLILWTTFFTALLFSWLHLIIPPEENSIFLTIVMVSIILILLSFSSLQTIVDEKFVRIKFSWGIFSKKFLLGDIASIKTVKNRWYYGWGIRIWFWPKMWIYNVSGFDAVELTMKSGKIYRIGTDVPQEFEAEIYKHLNK